MASFLFSTRYGLFREGARVLTVIFFVSLAGLVAVDAAGALIVLDFLPGEDCIERASE